MFEKKVGCLKLPEIRDSAVDEEILVGSTDQTLVRSFSISFS